MNSLKELLEKVKQIFENEPFIFEPRELYTPIDYTLSLGGKRIRPVLLMAGCEMFGGDINQVKDAALGIETFHNFTLLHDDLMDKSPIRRGQPTVYRKWNENTAILSGDTMFALAWRYFLRQSHPALQDILNTFNETAIGVCEGQQYDMNFETRNDVSIAEYMEMIRLKTAILLAGALKIGAQYANAQESDIQHLYDFGIHIGLAFQLQDDLLDAFGDVKVFGKQTGTDISDNKKTYLYLKALELADEQQRDTLQQLFATTPADPEEKIRTVLGIYQDLDVRNTVENIVNEEFAIALNELDAIHVDPKNKATLNELANTLLGRKV